MHASVWFNDAVELLAVMAGDWMRGLDVQTVLQINILA